MMNVFQKRRLSRACFSRQEQGPRSCVNKLLRE